MFELMKIVIRSVDANLRDHISDMCVRILPLPKKSNSLVCIESILRILEHIYISSTARVYNMCNYNCI